MRSRTGCATCRQRKVKCDERKPSCGQCIKVSRKCVSDRGVVFRHHLNASMNGREEGNDGTLRGFYAYKNTFSSDSVWVDIPPQIRFITTLNPYGDPPSPGIEDEPPIVPVQTTHAYEHRSADPSPGICDAGHQDQDGASAPGLDALFIAAMEQQNHAVPVTTADGPSASPKDFTGSLMPTTSALEQPISPSMSISNQNLDFILNPATRMHSPIATAVSSPFASCSSRSRDYRSVSGQPVLPIERSVETEHEMGFLLRNFSEGPGAWMDLFDRWSNFSSYVPIMASTHPGIKHAAAALSAKALGRSQGRKSMGDVAHHARTDLYPHAQSVDWARKGTKYYENAILLLRQMLQEGNGDTTLHSAEGNEGWPSRSHNGHPQEGRVVTFPMATQSSSDELLIATAILSVYEVLDTAVPEWSRHLNGAKSLLDIAYDGMASSLSPRPAALRSNLSIMSKARRATFWNIARLDMLAAFINMTMTRLDPEDLPLWKEAGLLLDEHGMVLGNHTAAGSSAESSIMAQEDMVANALVWLTAKLVNFMAAGDDAVPPGNEIPVALGIPQRTLLEYWHHLKRHFETWHAGLPITFKPSVRLQPEPTSPITPNNAVAESGQEPDTLIPETWYSMPLCAATMQWYHMTQIQLLLNKPHESTQGRSSVHERLGSYGAIVAHCEAHSREIVGIALVLRMLREVESETGWATEYRVRQLVEQWGWEERG